MTKPVPPQAEVRQRALRERRSGRLETRKGVQRLGESTEQTEPMGF